MKKFLIASVAVFGLATPAFAQDDTVASGFRLEAVAGIDNVDIEGEGDTGFAYGVAAGYDFNTGSNILVGADAEVTFSTTEKYDVDAGRDLYVGGRIGTQVGSGVLLYAKAGYTNARINVAGSNNDFNVDGVRVGAGIEAPLTDRFFVKAEYRYSNYELGIERHQGLAGVGVRF